MGQRGAHKNLIKTIPVKNVVVFTPNLPNSKSSDCYPEYCKLSLVRYLPWKDDYASAFGGSDSTEEEIVAQWEAHLLSLAAAGEDPPDHLIQEMRRLLETQAPGDGLHGNNLDGAGENISGEAEDLGYQLGDTYFDDDDDLVMDWDENHDWSNLVQDYSPVNGHQPIADPVGELSRLIVNDDVAVSFSVTNVSPDRLNDRQKEFFDIANKLLAYSPGESSTDGGDGFSRCILLRGRGGTGKSHTINSIRSQLQPCEQRTFAPTGKAATIIGGSTIYNAKSGLALPIGRTAFKPLQGRVLQSIQRKLKDVRIVFIDEYSMIHQKHLHWIDKRLQQAKGNNLLFGGIIVVLCGDTAQLPPVAGICLWDQVRRGKTDEALAGMTLYSEEFTTVIQLEDNMRLDENDPNAVEFESFLNRLADGKCTMDDWVRVKNMCSRDTLGQLEWQSRGFNGDDTTFLFCTNHEVQKANQERLKKGQHPILLVEAKNTNSRAKAMPSDRFRGLQSKVYLAVEAKVLLTWNLKPECGLSNGSTGTLKDYIFGDGDDYSMPLYTWVDFGDTYTGPTFFPDCEERKGWVPITPITADTYVLSPDGSSYTTLSRTMLPISLAWAWTIWKAQGQTIRSKVVMTLGVKEGEHGLSYVAFSRSEKFSNIGILGGISGDRLTTCISNQRKLKLRLKEDERLKVLVQNTRDGLADRNGN